MAEQMSTTFPNARPTHDSTSDSPQQPIWVSTREGSRLITFPPQRLWSWAEISQFELRSPAQTTSENLRSTRAKITNLQAQFDLRQLELILQRRFRTTPHAKDAPQHESELKQSLFPEIHLKSAGSTMICWGIHHPPQQRPTPFYLEAALHPSPQSLRIDLFRGFVFGTSSCSIALLAADLLKAAQLPALPSHPSALQIDPLTEISLAMCLERGWKLPAREQTLSARASGGHVILNVGDGAEHYLPSGAYAEHLKRLKDVSEGEQLLYRGEDQAALNFYQQLEPTPFSLLRVAELIRSKKLNPIQRAEAIGWLNATLRNDQHISPLARSWQLELRGELEEAAQALEEWWTIASSVPDERLARDLNTLRGIAAYSRALLLERSQPERALAAFEEARMVLPSSLGVLSGAARVALSLSNIDLADQRLSEQAQLLESRGLMPEAAWAWVQVAEVRRSLSSHADPHAAERAFTRALELEPTLISAHQGLAALAEERGEYALACERLDHALKVVLTKGPARAALEEMRQRFNQLSRPVHDLTPPISNQKNKQKASVTSPGLRLVDPPHRLAVALERRPKTPIPPPPRATPSNALDAKDLNDTAVVLTQRRETRPIQAPTSSPEANSDELDDSLSGDFLQVDYPATSLPPHEEHHINPLQKSELRQIDPTPPLRSYQPSTPTVNIEINRNHSEHINIQQTPALSEFNITRDPSSLPIESLHPSHLDEGDPLDSFIDVDEVSAELLNVESWEEALPDSMSRSAEPGPLMGELLEAEPLTGQPDRSRPELPSRAFLHDQAQSENHMGGHPDGHSDDSVSQIDLADVWLSNDGWDLKTEIGSFNPAPTINELGTASRLTVSDEAQKLENENLSELAQLKLNYAHLEGKARWEMALKIAQTARDTELDIDEAQRFFWEVLRVSEGKHPVALTAADELGELLTVNQDHQGMLALYDEMIQRELKPLGELYRLRAVTLNTLGQQEEALQALDLSIASGGDGSVELQVSILTALGHNEEAVAHLDAAAEAHEGNLRPQAQRARAIYLAQAAHLLKADYPQESLHRFKLAYQIDKTKERLEQWHQQAILVGDPYDQVEATEAYVENLAQDPNSTSLRVKLLTKLAKDLEMSSPMHSLSLYQEALELNQDHFDIADQLCELALKMEALEPLSVGLKRLIPLCLEGEYKGRMYMRLAFTLTALGHQLEGQEELRRALQEFRSVKEGLEELEELREVILWGRMMCSEIAVTPLNRLIEASPLSALLAL